MMFHKKTQTTLFYLFVSQLFLAQITLLFAGESFLTPQWQVREFHAPEELSHEEVWDIEAAKDGSVWFATGGGGVTRIYQGNREIYNNESGLCANYVRCIAEDRFGGVWAGTSKGISYIHQGVITNYTNENTLEIPNNSINDISIDPKGDVWISADHFQLFCFSLQSVVNHKPVGNWKRPDDYPPTEERQFKKLLFSADHILWLAVHYGGLGRWPASGAYELLTWDPDPKSMHPCYDLCFDSDGNIWACGSTNLVCFSNQGTLLKRLSLPYSLSAVAFHKGTLLVGTYTHGLFFLEGEELTSVPLSPEHRSPYIECICPSSDGTIWIGTREGAFRISRSSWQAIENMPGGAMPRSTTLTKADSGALFGIDIEENLYRNKTGKWEKIATLPIPAIPPRTPYNNFLLAGHQNDLYYRHFDTMYHINVNNPTKPEPLRLTPDFSFYDDFSRFYIDRNSTVWFLNHEGAFRWETDTWVRLPLSCERPKNNVFAAFEPFSGVLWFLGRGWVDEYKDHRVTSLPLPKSYTDTADEWSKIFNVVHYDNAYWFTTDRDGLLRYDGTTWQHLHHGDGLPSEGLCGLYVSSDNTLWVGSLRTGISSLKNGRWITYGVKEGLLNGSVDSFTEDSQGILWAQIRDAGLVCYTPDHNPPIVWINSHSENLIPGEKAVFTFDGHDAWNETKKQDMVFSWRILDEETEDIILDWTPYRPVRTMTTPRMSPGKYRLEVLAQDKNRNTSANPATASFVVLPYFWMTAHFQIPAGLALLFASIALGIWYVKHHALQQSEKRYRNLVEKDTLTLILNWNLDGTILYCNEKVETYFGMSAKYILGSSIQQFLGIDSTDQSAEFQNSVKNALANLDEPQGCQLRIDHRPSPAWISWFFRAVLDPKRNTKEIHAFGVDITQQVLNENALLHERMSIKEFFDSAQIGVFRLDEANHVTYLNPAMCTIIGHPKPMSCNENNGCRIDWLNPVQFNAFAERIRSNNHPASMVLEGYRIESRERFHVLVSGIQKENALEFMVLDFTEQKNLEKKIALSSSREQERLGRELHDGLCQQLVAVAYLAKILEKMIGTESQEMAELLGTMSQQIHDAIQQSRNVSRGLCPITVQQGGLRMAILDLVESYQQVYSISIQVELEDFEPFSNPDIANSLYRIAKEACFNAIKHADASSIQIYSFEKDNFIGLAISDNGRGIPSSHQKSKKTGMGLNLMNYQAESIGATLSIVSVPGYGTEVKCLFVQSALVQREMEDRLA